MIIAGPFTRGSSISLLAGVTLGQVGDVTGLPTAKLKLMKPGRAAMPGAEVPSVADFTVTPALATPNMPAGWMITLTATQTAALPAGTYVADVRFVVGGGVEHSDPVTFRLNEVVTT